MNRGESRTSSNKPERKTIEKNRRLRMKYLCNKLVSIIPDHHFNPAKEFLSQKDQIEQATHYIKILRGRIEELRRRKSKLTLKKARDCTNHGRVNAGGSNLPILKIRELGSSLQVVLISGVRKKFKLNQVLSIIEQEGAEVVTVNLSNVGDKIFHSVHAKVKISRLGMNTLKIGERIQELL